VVERGVVEDAPHWNARSRVCEQLRSKRVEVRVVVVRVVDPRRAVEAIVHDARPPARFRRNSPAGWIGGDTANLQINQQLLDLVREPGRVAWLEHETTRVARTHRLEERLRNTPVECETRRELHEQAAELLAERGDLGQKLVEQRLRVDEPPLVRDRLRDLR
jgi:hypothetical protein